MRKVYSSKVVFLLFSVICSLQVQASAGKPSLAYEFENAENILIAKKVGCAHRDIKGWCYQWQFEVVEILKGMNPATTPYLTLPKIITQSCILKVDTATEHSVTQLAGTADCDGAQRTIVAQGPVTSQKSYTCRLDFRDNDSFLLFLSIDGKASSCAGSVALGESVSDSTANKLQRLRQYRDGIIDDLSARWSFRNNAGTCELIYHSTKVRLAFSYWFAGHGGMPSIPGIKVSGQKIEKYVPSLAVGNPQQRKSTSVMPVVLRINQQAWPLVRQTIDMNVIASLIGEDATGEDIAIKIQKVESSEVSAVLALLRQPGKIEFEFEDGVEVGSKVAGNKRLIEQFEACMKDEP